MNKEIRNYTGVEDKIKQNMRSTNQHLKYSN